MRESPRAGSLAIPLVKSLKEPVGLFNPQAVRKSAGALCALATLHAPTPMLARTLMQPASITSFGFKCVAWAAPLVRSLKRLRTVAPNALQLRLSGTAGTLSSMKGKGARVSALTAQDLGLTLVPMS